MNIRNYKTTQERRKAIEKNFTVDLKNIGQSLIDDTVAQTRNCENMIGFTQVPLGVAGPLKLSTINNQQSTMYYLPLATTEGALVASVARGCKAITQSGGVFVDSHRIGATRAPVFYVGNLEGQKRLQDFLDTHRQELKEIARQSSGHLTLTDVTSRGVGTYRYVRFAFDTQDAMGMNMATIAVTQMCEYVGKHTGIRCISVSGNYCVDKKPSWLNVIDGRGIQVWAEAVIKKNILHTVLKTSAQKIFDTWLAKCMMGSAVAGSMAFNAQIANIVAALFLATGQDVAHTVEGSMGTTTAEVHGEDIYISVSLPDLMVGTVGGGTGLPTQREALSLLGVAGGDHGKNSQKFAEIIGGAVLAGKLSLLSSLSEGTLARAHARLARGGKT